MISGTVTVNGINDKELVKILEIKVRHGQSLIFNPQQLQPAQARQAATVTQGLAGQPLPQAQQPPPQPQQYNNAIFVWNDWDGLEAVQEIVSMFLEKEEHHNPKGAAPRQRK